MKPMVKHNCLCSVLFCEIGPQPDKHSNNIFTLSPSQIVCACILLAAAVVHIDARPRPRYVAIPLNHHVQLFEVDDDFADQGQGQGQEYARVERRAAYAEEQDNEEDASNRHERDAHGSNDHVDYGAHTGHHGAFGWYADFPVHTGH